MCVVRATITAGCYMCPQVRYLSGEFRVISPVTDDVNHDLGVLVFVSDRVGQRLLKLNADCRLSRCKELHDRLKH